MESVNINNHRGFTKLSGAERRIEWFAKGAIRCVAEREDVSGGSVWRLVSGPPNLVGRSWSNLRDMRAAASA